MTWRNSKLGDVLTLKRGHDLPNDSRREGDVPVVSSSGITGFHNEAKAQPPGVVTGRYSTIGEVFYLDRDYWPLNTALYVIDFKGTHPKFASYFLRNVLRNYQSDKAAVPGVDRNVLHQISVRVPSRKIQERIAEFVTAYDDLIENNRRRIELLEQSARLLYKEWFVHLRFPGHERTTINNGIPEGWRKTTADEAMEVFSGGTPKTNVSEYWDGVVPFFTPKDTQEFAYVFETEKSLTEGGLKHCASKLYPKDTLFITARGTVGKINLAQTDMAMNQSCYALVGKPPLNQHFLYFAMVACVEQFKSRAVGAVFDAIIKDTFKLIPFAIPNSQLISMFCEYASPVLRQIDLLATENRKLAAARDLLLPRLMNGEIAI